MQRIVYGELRIIINAEIKLQRAMPVGQNDDLRFGRVPLSKCTTDDSLLCVGCVREAACGNVIRSALLRRVILRAQSEQQKAVIRAGA